MVLVGFRDRTHNAERQCRISWDRDLDGIDPAVTHQGVTPLRLKHPASASQHPQEPPRWSGPEKSKSETANGARTNSLQNILGVVSAAGLKRRPPKIINPLEVYST